MTSDQLVFPVPDEWKWRAWMDEPSYHDAYERSLRNPHAFWAGQAKSLEWLTAPTKTRDVSFEPGEIPIRWFEDGVLNASVNCLDRHLDDGSRTAIIWEGDDPSESRTISYAELHAEVCRLANGLHSLGVGKGDRVTIYLPMVPEVAVAMLACARIGAIHSVVFAGFSSESLAGRIQDCESRVLITADEGVRGGRRLPMKANADEALKRCPSVSTCVVLRRTGGKVGWTEGRDLWYDELVKRQAVSCKPEAMGAEDPLFI
ncbi:MAG: AMP-binding protein, partial [Burkholderiales bacterium]